MLEAWLPSLAAAGVGDAHDEYCLLLFTDTCINVCTSTASDVMLELGC